MAVIIIRSHQRLSSVMFQVLRCSIYTSIVNIQILKLYRQLAVLGQDHLIWFAESAMLYPSKDHSNVLLLEILFLEIF